MTKRKLSNVGLIRKALKFSGREVAQMIDISPTNLSNIEKGDKDTSAVVAYRLANFYGQRADDLLNYFRQNVVLKEKRPLIRLSHAITKEREPIFVRDTESLNSPSLLNEYYVSGNDYDRYDLLTTCKIRIAQKEAETYAFKELGISEFVLPPTGEKPNRSNMPEDLKLGIAFAELTRVLGLSNKAISKEAGVSTSSISEIENDKGEVLISTLDAVARAIGLTVDELIFLVHPSPTKWIFFVQSQTQNYQNQQMLRLVTNKTTLTTFCNPATPVGDRVKLMLAYKEWMRAEWDARHSGKTVAATLPTAFRLLNFGT